jgi:hypothetical protein
MIRLWVLHYTLMAVLASSTCGDKQVFYGYGFTFQTTTPSGFGGVRERLAPASPVMTKSRSPSFGRGNYLENGRVKPPRHNTRALRRDIHVALTIL